MKNQKIKIWIKNYIMKSCEISAKSDFEGLKNVFKLQEKKIHQKLVKNFLPFELKRGKKNLKNFHRNILVSDKNQKLSKVCMNVNHLKLFYISRGTSLNFRSNMKFSGKSTFANFWVIYTSCRYAEYIKVVCKRANEYGVELEREMN